MREVLKRSLRFRVLEPVRHLADHAVTRLGDRPASVRLLAASDDLNYTSEQQLAPLYAYRERLRRDLGVMFGHLLVKDALALPPPVLRSYDVLLLKLVYRTPAEEAVSAVRRLRERAGPGVRLVYLDGDDDICVQWPAVLRDVDLYVKMQVFRDRARYTEARIGKSNLTEHAARFFGTSFDDDIIPRTPGVDPADVARITLGWGFALGDHIRRLWDPARRGPPDGTRDIDVTCRASLNGWIRPFRWPVVPALRRLEPKYRVRTPQQRVSHAQYIDEMRRSRICVSPFGHGEVCLRDFEAILTGCLLVKPDMSHLETEPDVFRPSETYVPVRWDFADLEDVLRRYLERPRELDAIRRRAYEVLDEYYRSGGFERSFARILTLAGLEVVRTSAR